MFRLFGSWSFGFALQVATAIFQLCTLASLLAADPGPGLPIFRRPAARPASPAAPSPKLDVQKPSEAPQGPQVIGVTVEQTAGPEVDVAEVLRRGDHVSRAGRGPMSDDDRRIGDAVAPPRDDSDKWFVTVIVDDGKESQALLYDLKHSPRLRAWALIDEPKDSWSHVTVYKHGDQSQDWRWKHVKFTRLPVVILQPPAKLMDERDPKSWQWGDPTTVVWQWDGYDATQPLRAELRAEDMRKKYLTYRARIEASRPRYAGPADRPTPGARQAAPASSGPIAAPAYPQVPGVPNANPFVTPDPTTPPSPFAAPAGGLSLLLTAMGMLGGGGGLTNVLLISLIGVQLWREWRKRTGQSVFLDDRSFALFTEFLRGLSQSTKSPTTPTT